MSLILNHFTIMKFHVVKTEITLIRKTDYFEYYLNTKADNIYKTNIYIFAHLNEANIVKILNTHQKLSILKENGIIIHNIIDSIIYNT